MANNHIICVVGPTASGKTALAVELAKAFDGEVVSFDSMQIYRRMDIGTAKPTKEEMQGIPHHMIDIIEPDEAFSVGRYVELADPIVRDILARGKRVILAGGTGLYVDALIRGGEFAPIPSTGCRERLEARAADQGIEALMAELAAIDPEALQRSQGNPRRIIRALEVFQETGETITAHDLRTRSVPPKYDPLWIGLDFESRQELYDRIDLRVELMVKNGLLEEIREILGEGIPESATAMQAIGYKEFVNAMAGRDTLENAIAQVQQASRRYAKRQLTWFRKNPNIHWICRKPGQSGDEIFEAARQTVLQFDN
ncbi:MAG: tRNA (adenosine(37)-N6)-dimethylallyltransferase MiaA [Oscillospiraceae bacterium]|nr:tRNA (adenosine(37)-N6)-dimethylallyltransferase MiaA [Oscillospiraceae bacterium]